MLGTRLVQAVLILTIAYIVNFLNVFSSTPEQQEQYSSCEYLHLPNHDLLGAEDGVVFDNDTVLFTQANLHKLLHGLAPLSTIPKGRIYAVQGFLNQKYTVTPVKIIGFPEQLYFFPHGLDFDQSTNILHIINHSMSTGGERIETFQITQTSSSQSPSLYEFTATHMHASIMNPQVNGISNDLVFLSPTRFILSQWMMHPLPVEGAEHQPIWKLLSALVVQLTKSKMTQLWDCVYIPNENAQCKIAHESAGVVMNGLAFDGKHTLLTTDTLSREIRVYELQGQDKELKLVQTIPSITLADNLTYDAKNDVYYNAGMKSTLHFLLFSSQIETIQSNTSNKPNVPTGSIVETISRNPTTGLFEITNLFASSSTIAGLSGACTVANDEYLFLLSFIDKAPVVCKRNIQIKQSK